MDQKIIPSTVKKFKTKQDYFAACKDGLIFGKRKGSGKHLTLLQEDNRLTMHITDPKSGQREHIFSGENTKEKEAVWEMHFKTLLLRNSLKQNPKWIYAIPNSAFRFDLEISKNGKECLALFPSGSRLLQTIVRMPYTEFFASDCFIGFTRAGSLVMKGQQRIIILSKKSMRRLARSIIKIPLFAALAKGKKML